MDGNWRAGSSVWTFKYPEMTFYHAELTGGLADKTIRWMVVENRSLIGADLIKDMEFITRGVML